MKRLLLLTAFITGYFPFSCVPPCGGGQSFTTIGELSTTIGSFGPSGFTDVPSTDFATVAISVHVEQLEYFSANTIDLLKSFELVSSAYACSPPPPEPTQALAQIAIVSTDSIFLGNDELPPASDITDFFVMPAVDDGITVTEFIALQNEDLWLFGSKSEQMLFQLQNAPDRAINQPLVIECAFTDGVSFRLQTDPLIIDM